MELKIYEGLFLVNNSEARKDYDAVSQRVEGIITKYGGEIQRNERWGERKLAYPVKKRDRGTYMLIYFNAPPESISQIKRDCVIDEVVMRNMILRINVIPEQKARPVDEDVSESKEGSVTQTEEERSEETQPVEEAAEDAEPAAVEAVNDAPEGDDYAEQEVSAVEEPVAASLDEPAEEPGDKQADDAGEAV